jgi:hypothetical protein
VEDDHKDSGVPTNNTLLINVNGFGGHSSEPLNGDLEFQT